MNIARAKVIQQIYDRLARLEDSREEARINNQDCSAIDAEMKALRLKLQDVMNSVCPVLR